MVFALVLPSQAALFKGDNTKIIVAGIGVVKAPADVSYINIGVERTEKSASEAQKIVAGKMNNVLSSLDKLGIPKDKIKTTEIRLSPKYEYVERKRTLVGYTANNEINVTLDKFDILGRIIDSVIAAGATNISNINFSIKNDAAAKKSALQQAFNNAKEKAETIAAASGLVLKRIKTIQEAQAQVMARDIQAFKTEAIESETPVLPGKIEVKANITVVYECDQAKK